jgi:hypothetical protein
MVGLRSFGYGNLNRLLVAAEKPTAGFTPTCPDATSVWCQSFTYDAPGNRVLAVCRRFPGRPLSTTRNPRPARRSKSLTNSGDPNGSPVRVARPRTRSWP